MRGLLVDELHARPSLRVDAPVSLTHLAVFADADVHWDLLDRLCGSMDLTPVQPEATHYLYSTPTWQVKWERHTEFSTFTFVARRMADGLFDGHAVRAVPADWFALLEGKRLAGIHAEVLGADAAPDARQLRELFKGPRLVGSRVQSGAEVYCDWIVYPDGYSRFLIIDHELREGQAGRLLQRLYEIETYRMMALLALPTARQLGRSLDALQAELTEIMERMDANQQIRQDPELLILLTHLAVRAQGLAGHGSRFSASRAYERLVLARIGELRETRIEGVQTIGEFMQRRLLPAMDTCRAVWARQEQFATRIARAIDLLRTRVNLAQEQHTTALLEGMNRTARNQLHLQHAVEGLSVAAISYYVLNLAGAALKAMHAAHLPVDPEVGEGLLIIPVVAIIVFATRRLKRRHALR